MVKTSDRDISALLDEIERHYQDSFGEDCHWGITLDPGIDEYWIFVWYEIQYKKDPEFAPIGNNQVLYYLADVLKTVRDAGRVGRCAIRKANGATRDDAIRSLWRQMFEAESA